MHSFMSASAQGNPIVIENQLAGTDDWALSNPADDISMQISTKLEDHPNATFAK